MYCYFFMIIYTVLFQDLKYYFFIITDTTICLVIIFDAIFNQMIFLLSMFDRQSSERAASDSTSDSGVDPQLSHHTLVCALHQLGSTVQSLGTSAAPLVSEPSTGIVEPVVSVLIHPSPPARLAAAWCLRSISQVCMHAVCDWVMIDWVCI